MKGWISALQVDGAATEWGPFCSRDISAQKLTSNCHSSDYSLWNADINKMGKDLWASQRYLWGVVAQWKSAAAAAMWDESSSWDRYERDLNWKDSSGPSKRPSVPSWLQCGLFPNIPCAFKRSHCLLYCPYFSKLWTDFTYIKCSFSIGMLWR